VSASVVVELVLICGLASCGSGDDSPSLANRVPTVGAISTVMPTPVTTLTSGPSTTSTSKDATTTDGPLEAVVTDWPVPSPDRPVGWMLVELTGTGIGGVTTLVLEVPYDEVGCGAEGRPIRFDQFEPGTTLTFERGQADTQSPLSGEVTSGWPPTVPVSAVRVRTACPTGSDEAAASVADHRAIWEAAGLGTYDYTMRYTTDFLYGTYRISVVDGAPVSAERLEDGEIKNYLDVAELPKSIDEVFDQLEREVAGDRFVGAFDDELGYPTHVLVDRIDNAVDDEWEFFISDFVIRAADTAPDSALTPSDDLKASTHDAADAAPRCGQVPNGPDDLTAEPRSWVQDGLHYRWHDRDGCPVRVDVVSHIRGPEHCDWQNVQFITIGEPIGTSIGQRQADPAARRFVWDPTGALNGLNGIGRGISIDAAELPDSADDTGYRLDGTELWVDTADSEVAYLLHDQRADILTQDVGQQAGCA
jgi:hypothetical protein